MLTSHTYSNRVLDPEVERPGERPFRRNLADYVLEHSGELVNAALAIPLAYKTAGSPTVNERRSRFTAWDGESTPSRTSLEHRDGSRGPGLIRSGKGVGFHRQTS